MAKSKITKREIMKMKDEKGREGLIEEIIPFGSQEFDYDDDVLEIYDEEFDKKLDEELAEIIKNAKRRKE